MANQLEKPLTTLPANIDMAIIEDSRTKSLHPGSARVPRAGDGVSPPWTSLKDYFGGTPKPARETHALPRS